jgi:hypothetical protein
MQIPLLGFLIFFTNYSKINICDETRCTRKPVSQILRKLLTYYKIKLRYRVGTHWFVFKRSLIRNSARKCAILTEVFHTFPPSLRRFQDSTSCYAAAASIHTRLICSVIIILRYVIYSQLQKVSQNITKNENKMRLSFRLLFDNCPSIGPMDSSFICIKNCLSICQHLFRKLSFCCS